MLKKTSEAPYTTKVNYRDRATRGTTRLASRKSQAVSGLDAVVVQADGQLKGLAFHSKARILAELGVVPEHRAISNVCYDSRRECSLFRALSCPALLGLLDLFPRPWVVLHQPCKAVRERCVVAIVLLPTAQGAHKLHKLRARWPTPHY